MFESPFAMREKDFAAIQVIIDGLVEETGARGVLVIDRVGQLLSRTGRMEEFDTTSLASLAAGCVAATGGLARLLGEDDFPSHFHQGESGSLYISRVDERGILIVFFDRASSLGLVRLRARKGSAALAHVFEEAQKENEARVSPDHSAFANITDEEIDNLFSD
ncbi:MAG: roadblock/LC7 domain-containing protein [Myxococcota bacterium]|nr:roadblock/LC7 domain-containing protein [Myxococcota bacterium]